MSNICILFGEIPIYSEKDAIDIQKVMKRRMFIDIFQYHPKKKLLVLDAGFDKLKHINWLEKYVYKKISECLPEKMFGKLYFKEGQFFSCIYFSNNRYQVVDYKETLRPDWWKGK